MCESLIRNNFNNQGVNLIYKEMERRRYFQSTLQQYNFPQVKAQTYLYIYKHNFPQIVVRFPQPKKTMTGFRLYHAEIIYHPFYQEINQNKQQFQSHNTQIQKIEIQYQGEIILHLQTSIFYKYFQQEVLNYLKMYHQQTELNKIKNIKIHKKPFQQHSFHLSPNVYTQNNQKYPHILQTQISQIFKILLKQWLKDTHISSMFLITQKHSQTFQSYDHGFIELQILKTSDKTLKVPFHRYMIERQWTEQQMTNYYQLYSNKIAYFQFQSSIFFTQNEDYHYVQKLGLIVPNPLTINQFFYQTLLMIFGEFQATEKQKQDKKKRQQERIKNRQALLDNLRKIGVEGDLPDLKDYIVDTSKPLKKQDTLDKQLDQLFSKDRHNKNLAKNLSYIKGQVSYTEHLTTFHNHNQSFFENSPRRRLSTRLSDMREEEPKIEEQILKRFRSPTINNVRIVRSFTSELLDDDFQQQPKRRFLTRNQFLKILEYNEHVMKKKEQKQRKKHFQQNTPYESPRKLKQQFVYVGIGNSQKQSSLKKKPQHLNQKLRFDYFAVHDNTVIYEDEPKKQPAKYQWQEDDELQSYDYYQDPQQYGQKVDLKDYFVKEQQVVFERKNAIQLDSSFMDELNRQLQRNWSLNQQGHKV